MLITIPLDALSPHPGNANVMPSPLFRKLCRHIERTRRYPPIIVRPLPGAPPARAASAEVRAPSYQILDGHHRARALRELGETEARCDVWDVDDREATILLLTLNRLEGSDDPGKRAGLLEELRRFDPPRFDLKELEKLLPEDERSLERLLALARPPIISDHLEGRAPDIEPLTFFVTKHQRERLLARLREVCVERTAALLRALEIDEGASS